MHSQHKCRRHMEVMPAFVAIYNILRHLTSEFITRLQVGVKLNQTGSQEEGYKDKPIGLGRYIH